MNITTQQIRLLMPQAKEIDILQYLPPCNEAMVMFQIGTPIRIRAYLANLAHECNELKAMQENLNYSATGLLKTFGKYFTAQSAKEYAHKPEMIANRVYANRLGNSDELSGDGWKYRGRGGIQLTGKENYRQMSEWLDYDFVKNPEALATPAPAMYSAACFWEKKGCNKLADFNTASGFISLVKKINGGTNGLADRQEYWEKSKRIIL